MVRDRYYTPVYLVHKMISCVSDLTCDSVADFSVGDGALLQSALLKWPNCRVVGTDIDCLAIAKLRRRYPSWVLGCCDFMSVSSRKRSRILSQQLGHLSLILLNPPFSGKGGKRWLCDVYGKRMFCSQALAFVAISLQYLHTDGHLVAILPASCIKSNKDKLLWSELSNRHTVRIVESVDNTAFRNCFAKTVIVHIVKSCKPSLQVDRNYRNPTRLGISVEIYRGKCQVHRTQFVNGRRGYPFIHSTNLIGNLLKISTHRVRSPLHAISGPAVLMPRVGTPNVAKIVVVDVKPKFVLSDCVIALKCSTVSDAYAIRDLLISNWDLVTDLYMATCAPYITMSSLIGFLNRFNCIVTSYMFTNRP